MAYSKQVVIIGMGISSLARAFRPKQSGFLPGAGANGTPGGLIAVSTKAGSCSIAAALPEISLWGEAAE